MIILVALVVLMVPLWILAVAGSRVDARRARDRQRAADRERSDRLMEDQVRRLGANLGRR